MRLTKAAINLKALFHNYSVVRDRVGSNVKIMGVVKANAYGHGLVAIARALEGFGCDYLAVAFVEEAIILREQGCTKPILVLAGVRGEEVRYCWEFNLDSTVTSLEMAEVIDREARRARKKVNVHLKIDTGMERIGVRANLAIPFVQAVSRMKNLNPVGVYSHFATSDDTKSSFMNEQLVRFMLFVQEIEKLGISFPLQHIANSGGILNQPDSYCSLVRPGIMLYGYSPSKEERTSSLLQPVLSLTTNIIYLKSVPASTSVSYGRTYYTQAPTTIATVPIGYGDGLSRRLSNQSHVLIHGRRFPVVGTICMDQCMIDVGSDLSLSVGDQVTFIGGDGSERISAWDLADGMGTIPYEALTGISERVPRIYLS